MSFFPRVLAAKMVVEAPGGMSRSGITPELTLARNPTEAAKQGGIARAGGIRAGTNPAPLIRCCHLAWARSASQAGRSLCYPALYPPD